MKDRQKIFLDKVVKLIVDDTRIDYDRKEIYFPSSPSLHFYPSPLFLFLPSPPLFSFYCKYNYGLTKEEIKYVWDQYKNIIKDKISKREP